MKKKFFDIVNLSVFFLVLFILFFVHLLTLAGLSEQTKQENFMTNIAGCYYLVDHGDFTQVSAEVYYFMYALQLLTLIGFVCFIASIIIMAAFKSDGKGK